MGTSAMAAAFSIISLVIFFAPCACACAQSTPGKSVPARPIPEQVFMKFRRSSISLTSPSRNHAGARVRYHTICLHPLRVLWGSQKQFVTATEDCQCVCSFSVCRPTVRGKACCEVVSAMGFIANGLVGAFAKCPLPLTCSGPGRSIPPKSSAEHYRTRALPKNLAAGLPNSHSVREEILMSASTTAVTSSTSAYTTPAFWERLWSTAGIQSVGLSINGYVIYGYQPHIGASTDVFAAFYDGDRTHILIAAVFFGLSILNLLWFAAALRTTLSDAGQDGWGAAATASRAAPGALFLLLIAVGAALAYSVAGSGSHVLTSGLNDFAWAALVVSSLPAAMLTISAAFGLWRAGLISNALFAGGSPAAVVAVLGGIPGLSWRIGAAYGP